MTLDVRWIIESGILSYTDNLIKYLKEKTIFIIKKLTIKK